MLTTLPLCPNKATAFNLAWLGGALSIVQPAQAAPRRDNDVRQAAKKCAKNAAMLTMTIATTMGATIIAATMKLLGAGLLGAVLGAVT